MSDYIFSARNIIIDTFGDEADSIVHYLIVPDNTNTLSPANNVTQKEWLLTLIAETKQQGNKQDILVYIHGFNNTETDVLSRHRIIKDGLKKQGYSGNVISFDWPCEDKAIMYLPDRHKAKMTAMQLVKGGIALLAAQQQKNCIINVHILAHSTGAYVVREAFDDADDTNKVNVIDEDIKTINLNAANWMITQMIFVEGDISSNSMSKAASDSKSLFKHTVRLTNYSNPYDSILALSNIKRAGFENRVGRVGLPLDAPSNSVNVNCGLFYNAIPDSHKIDLAYSHSWYFDPAVNTVFMQDLNETIKGEINRNYIPTREVINNELFLVTAIKIPQ